LRLDPVDQTVAGLDIYAAGFVVGDLSHRTGVCTIKRVTDANTKKYLVPFKCLG
jgi:hypothetical protein